MNMPIFATDPWLHTLRSIANSARAQGLDPTGQLESARLNLYRAIQRSDRDAVGSWTTALRAAIVAYLPDVGDAPPMNAHEMGERLTLRRHALDAIERIERLCGVASP